MKTKTLKMQPPIYDPPWALTTQKPAADTGGIPIQGHVTLPYYNEKNAKARKMTGKSVHQKTRARFNVGGNKNVHRLI